MTLFQWMGIDAGNLLQGLNHTQKVCAKIELLKNNTRRLDGCQGHGGNQHCKDNDFPDTIKGMDEKLTKYNKKKYNRLHDMNGLRTTNKEIKVYSVKDFMLRLALLPCLVAGGVSGAWGSVC